MDQPTTQGKIMSIQLSDAIDSGLATLACNERPEGWRVAEFDTLIAYVHPDCPEILGELEPGFANVLAEGVPVVGLVIRPSENRSWDFRPFGQSEAVRKHRLERGYLRVNAWKVKNGLLSRKVAKKAAKKFADRAASDDACAGCKCAVRMGSRTWLAIL